MTRSLAFCMLLVASVAMGAPAKPQKLAKAEADSVTRAILKDRADTEDWLQHKPNSYLATVQRRDFDDHTLLSVGRAADNELRVDDPGIPAHALRVTVVGDSFHVEAVDPDARFTAGKLETREAMLPPSSIGLGRFTIRLSHQRYPALIVFDPQSPRFSEYHGLRYFPVDLRYRFVAPLIPNPAADTVVIQSTRGNLRRAVKVGWFEFPIGGKTARLEATRLLEPGVGERDMSLFFRDATTGKETYSVGRYVEPELLPDGSYLIDFNVAYNPACAFSTHYNCPIPPRSNVIKTALRVGEMDSNYLSH